MGQALDLCRTSGQNGLTAVSYDGHLFRAAYAGYFRVFLLFFAAFMLATQLNSLIEEERLSAHCICQVNRYIVNSLKDGRYSCIFRYGHTNASD